MALANVATNVSSPQVRVYLTIAANATSGTLVNGNIATLQTDTTGTTPVTVQPQEVWHIVNAYVAAALATDMLVDIYVGGTPQNINFSTATVITGSTSKINPFFGMKGLTIPGNSTIEVKGLTTAAAGTAQVVETLFLEVIRQPLGNLGAPKLQAVPQLQ